MIKVSHLRKVFTTSVVREGYFKGLRALFSRERQEKVAVREISFEIGQGEFVGYIGPNGAGKSTTIKCLSGILHPTSGDVSVAGLNPYKQRIQVARKIGVVFGQRTQLWWDLPVADSFDILAAIYRVPEVQKRAQIAALDDLLHLGEIMKTPVRKLSLGQRMKADIAAAVLHNPDILFLDEPTIGLDVVVKRSIRQYLKELNQQLGKTILLTTHDMNDIEKLCNRVVVINRGELIYSGSIQALRDRIGLHTLCRVTFRDQIAPQALESTGDYRVVERNDRTLTIRFNRQTSKAMEVIRYLEQWGQIEDLQMVEPEFEEVVQSIY
jgi:ABC-2 type transport system ATP-binding protein